ncbi:MAG: signal recognition particle-docking protein FtsY, partial [Candidatus Heimdallarchaeota archaeon]|nr:signal recognition particle-docking protein FtsY [Candidatus Heimdallarchaeota archaeon]
SCVFAAGDTFRAAAIQQLEEHADNLSVKIIKHDYGADSSAVIFDAVRYAESKNVDVVLADTAGRNHHDSNLLEELKKIRKVIEPDLCLLVVESIAGNDVVEQAKKFSEVKLDGFVLSKWDVDDKGGAALTLTYMVNKPVYFLGTGQGYSDLKVFDLEEVVNNII